MSKSPIGVIDSGIGGASILKEVMQILPDERFIYLADTKNMPYGTKSKSRIYKIVRENVDFLIQKFHIKLLIIACNTASSACSFKLRQKLKIPIVCIEPPLKPVVEYGYKKILILATKSTLRNNMTIRNSIKIIKRKNKLLNNENRIIVKKLAIDNLASEIDKNHSNFDALKPLLEQKLKKYRDFEAVVIGCTHYNFIKKQIGEVLPDIQIISCETPVARRVKFILNRESIASDSKGKLKDLVILTKPNLRLKRFLQKYLEI